MKKYFISAIVALTSAVAFAQNNNDTLSAQADTHIYNNLVSRSGKTWKFNFLSISTEGNSTVETPVQSNNETSGNSSYNVNVTVHKPCHKHTEIGIDKWYLGVSSLGKTEGFELNPASSLEFGFSILTSELYNSRRTFGVESALFTSWTRYSVKSKNVFYDDADGHLVCNTGYVPAGEEYHRSRLTYASWRVPVTLNWCGDNVKYSLGIEGELRHHLRSRIKYDGDKKHYAKYGDMDVNPWGVNALLAIGSDHFQFFGRYSLTQFFDTKGTDLRGTPFMIGIIWK